MANPHPNTAGLKIGVGRVKGVPNKATAEVREIAQRIVGDPAYRAALTLRVQRGKAAPAIEVLLWHYAFGKPKDIIEHQGRIDGDRTSLSDAELAAQAQRILRRAEDAE